MYFKILLKTFQFSVVCLLQSFLFAVVKQPTHENIEKYPISNVNKLLPSAELFFSLSDISPNESIVENENLNNFRIQDYSHETDFRSVKKIFKNNWELLFFGTYDKEVVLNYLSQKKSSNYGPNNLIIKTVKINDETVGFVGYVLYDSVNYFDPTKKGPKKSIYMCNAPLDAGHIEIIAVNKLYRKQGLGILLLNYASKDLINLGAKRIDIFVKVNNIPALNCYQKLGFKKGWKYRDDNLYFYKAV